MSYLLLLLATLATSLISGVLSMAGGMILMGVFSLLLSVPAAMVLHGIAQSFSNGSRVWLYRRHIKWTVLIPYGLGSLIVLLLFIWLTLAPDKALIFIVIGSFPFLAMALPTNINLDMQRTCIAFLSGIVVTLAQMLAGASGPVLDVFYVKSSLTRHEILGTKAITQTLGHMIKLSYYAYFFSLSITLPVWVYTGVIIAAIAGNAIGKTIVERIDDHQFKLIGRYLIMAIGLLYIAKGMMDLFS